MGRKPKDKNEFTGDSGVVDVPADKDLVGAETVAGAGETVWFQPAPKWDEFGLRLLLAITANPSVYRGGSMDDAMVVRMAIRLRKEAADAGLVPQASDELKN